MQTRRRSDRQLVASLIKPRRGSFKGLSGIPVEDNYYVPDHFTPMDISTELGNFENPKTIVVGALAILLGWWLYKRYS